MPPMETSATSVVPAPMSTTKLPCGSYIAGEDAFDGLFVGDVSLDEDESVAVL